MILARVRAVRRELPDAYWVVWLGTLINRLGGFVAPLLTFYLTGERGLSVGTAGLIVALHGVGGVGAALVGGVLADRLGRRPTMLVSMFGGGVAMALLGFARHEATIAALTFGLGFVGELYRPAVMAFVGDVVPAAQRLRAFALLYWVINLSFAVASALGGLLARWSYTALFLIDAATMIGYGVLVAVRLPESRPPAHHDDAPPIGLLQVLTDGTFMRLWALSFGMALIVFQSSVSLSAHLVGQGFDQVAYGAIMAVNGVVIVLLQPVAAARLGRLDPSRVLAGAALLVGGGFALHGVSPYLAVHLLAVLVWTLGEIAAAPTHAAVVAHLSPPTARGRYQGVFGMSWGAASAVGPLAGGAIVAHAGAGALWAACLGVGLITAAGYLATAAGRRARGA